MRIKLIKIELRDLGPFVGEHSLILPENGVVLLSGEIDGTGESSGAGKSFLLNSIPFVLGGSPYPATNFQSWHTDKAPWVKLTFNANGNEFTIERGKSLKIVKDGKEIVGKAATAEIDVIFGIDKDMRQLLTYREQNSMGAFLSMTDSDKKQFLTKLLGLERFEIKANEAAKKAAELSKTLDGQQLALESLRVTCSDYLAKIQNLPPVPEVDFDLESIELAKSTAEQKLFKLKTAHGNAIKKIREKLFEDIKTIAVEPVDTTKHDNALKVLNAVQFQAENEAHALESRNKEINKEISSIKIKAAKAASFREELFNTEMHLQELENNTCFTCKRLWIDEEHQAQLEKEKVRKTELEQLLAEVMSMGPKFKALSEELQANNKAIDKLNNLEVVSRASEAYKTAKEELDIERSNQETIKNEKVTQLDKEAGEKIAKFDSKFAEESSNLNKTIADCQNKWRQFTEYESQVKAQRILLEEYQKQLHGTQDRIKAHETDIQRRLEEINSYRDLASMLGRDGFLGVIFDEVLDEAASIANEFFAQIANVQHVSVRFDSEYETQDGNLNRKIVPVFNIGGHEAGFRGAGLSGGMSSSVQLPIDLAFSEIVMRNRGVFPGWLVLDEPFNGLGDKSKEAALEMLTAMSEDRLIIVVDHSSQVQNVFAKTITIKQKAGHSSIEALE